MILYCRKIQLLSKHVMITHFIFVVITNWQLTNFESEFKNNNMPVKKRKSNINDRDIEP